MNAKEMAAQIASLTASIAALTANAPKPKGKAEKPARQEKSPVPAEFADLEGHVCTVTGGRKFPGGTQLDVTKVGMSRYNTPYARGYKGTEEVYIDPKFLKKGKALTDLRLTELQSRQDETIRFRATVRNESEKAIVLRPYPLYQGISVAKSNVTEIVEGHDGTEFNVYEVPAWAVRQKVGPAMYDLLVAEAETHKLNELE